MKIMFLQKTTWSMLKELPIKDQIVEASCLTITTTITILRMKAQ
jgi:hypothetical protein